MKWSSVGALDFGLLPRPSSQHLPCTGSGLLGGGARDRGVAEWSGVPLLHVSLWILLLRLGMLCGRMTLLHLLFYGLRSFVQTGCSGGWRECGGLCICLVLSTPPRECPRLKPIPNLHDTHFSSMCRQLIQKLRLKQEKKSFQMKEKKAEMQGESAGEQARGKGLKSWQQIQRQKYKAAATHASKQVNLDGRGAPVPSTLPRLGPIRGGLPRRPLLRAQTH